MLNSDKLPRIAAAYPFFVTAIFAAINRFFTVTRDHRSQTQSALTTQLFV